MRIIVALIFFAGIVGAAVTAEFGGAVSAQPAPSLAETEMDQGGAKDGKASLAEAWKEEARTLAEAYRLALKQRYKTKRVSEKRKVYKEIKEIKKRRDELLAEAQKVRLLRRDRIEIEEILAVIAP